MDVLAVLGRPPGCFQELVQLFCLLTRLLRLAGPRAQACCGSGRAGSAGAQELRQSAPPEVAVLELHDDVAWAAVGAEAMRWVAVGGRRRVLCGVAPDAFSNATAGVLRCVLPRLACRPCVPLHSADAKALRPRRWRKTSPTLLAIRACWDSSPSRPSTRMAMTPCLRRRTEGPAPWPCVSAGAERDLQSPRLVLSSELTALEALV